MQTKSEMINRIAELAQEVEQWKHEYEVLDACCELAQGKIAELKAENDRLNEEVETRDNLVEHFRKEAINWAKISNDCIKDIEKYKQTLQEIKKYIAKICKEECGYVQKKRCPDCDCRFGAILDLITKAEEE